MKKMFDRTAIASDAPRSFTQYAVRGVANIVVNILGLNRPNILSTEISQSINPVATIKTKYGVMWCRAGHGRLVWRAKTFHTEEPQTISWLDTLKKDDIFWDVGANVGLYSIYAAKFIGCKVIAFEPESQNYALLVENIVLNNVSNNCSPASFAITNQSGTGYLKSRYLTKGGAYNCFSNAQYQNQGFIPESIKALDTSNNSGIEQLIFGISLDDLFMVYGLLPPNYLKIDVDGLEPLIINGAAKLLQKKELRSILIEINQRSKDDLKIPEILKKYGFRLAEERSNWLSRNDRTRQDEMPTTNMIFRRE